MTQLTEHQNKVLQALKNAGTKGLNSYSEFRKDHALQISGTIKELREKGYMIKSSRAKGDRSATYFLLHVPEQLKKSSSESEVPARHLPVPEVRVLPLDIERRKQALREEWKTATPERREAILLQVKPLDSALRAMERRAQIAK